MCRVGYVPSLQCAELSHNPPMPPPPPCTKFLLGSFGTSETHVLIENFQSSSPVTKNGCRINRNCGEMEWR